MYLVQIMSTNVLFWYSSLFQLTKLFFVSGLLPNKNLKRSKKPERTKSISEETGTETSAKLRSDKRPPKFRPHPDPDSWNARSLSCGRCRSRVSTVCPTTTSTIRRRRQVRFFRLEAVPTFKTDQTDPPLKPTDRTDHHLPPKPAPSLAWFRSSFVILVFHEILKTNVIWQYLDILLRICFI